MYEDKKTKRIKARLRQSNFAVDVNEGLSKLLFKTKSKLSSIQDVEIVKMHLVSHAGITCEPVILINNVFNLINESG